jgi:hypothetical protein
MYEKTEMADQGFNGSVCGIQFSYNKCQLVQISLIYFACQLGGGGKKSVTGIMKTN